MRVAYVKYPMLKKRFKIHDLGKIQTFTFIDTSHCPTKFSKINNESDSLITFLIKMLKKIKIVYWIDFIIF